MVADPAANDLVPPHDNTGDVRCGLSTIGFGACDTILLATVIDKVSQD